MKCMSCLGFVVRLNSFRGFNLAHTKGVSGWCGLCWGLTMGTSTSKGAGVGAGLPRKARVSREWPWMTQWGGASDGALPRVSRGGEASDGASPCESSRQPRGVPGWWS